MLIRNRKAGVADTKNVGSTGPGQSRRGSGAPHFWSDHDECHAPSSECQLLASSSWTADAEVAAGNFGALDTLPSLGGPRP